MDFRTTSVFAQNLHAYVERVPIIANQGGTRSSKTYSILQLLLLIAVNAKRPRVISIVSRTLTHLKKGAIRSFDEILVSYGIIPETVRNKTESIYTINGCIIEFFGTDQLAKVHGPERDILFINEANFVKAAVVDQLLIRTRGTTFIDFNPSQEFWFHDEEFQARNLRVIKSTYRDNEHLSQNQIANIEYKKKNKKWWRVYGEGELGQLEGAVFEDRKLGAFDHTIPYLFAQDYGFSKDPTTLIKVGLDVKRNRLYAEECHYSVGVLKANAQIAEMNISHAGSRLIVGDSASTQLIYSLRHEFGVNIVPCLSESKKSVAQRLLRMLDYELIVDPDSSNLLKELDYYTWTDKKSNLVIDDWNHLIDPLGYGFDYLLFKGNRKKSRVHVPKG